MLRSHSALAGLTSAALVAVSGCAQLPTGDTISTGTYEAMAEVTYTWQVEYIEQSDRPNDVRYEKFASNSLVNRNGLEPDAAVTGPDDEGLYWPALPPRPTAAELRANKGRNLRTSDPQLLKDVNYSITFDHQGRRRTLPTNADVYWEASQAFANEQALELTYGPSEQAIADAEAIANFER